MPRLRTPQICQALQTVKSMDVCASLDILLSYIRFRQLCFAQIARPYMVTLMGSGKRLGWYHRIEDKEGGPMLSVLVATCVALLVLIVLWITIKACVEDARRRGKSPLLVTIAAILFFPWGTIAWLLFRPDPLNPNGEQRQFRLEDYRVQ